MDPLIINKKTRKIRSLTKEHREKIYLAHKGKKKNYSFANRKRPSITPTWFRIPVVCINTGKSYNSLTEAAEEVYQNKCRYKDISEVCRAIKPHYKKYIWRFEEDFLALSETEKQDLKNKCTELYKIFIKYTTKLLYKGRTYDSFVDLGLVLHDDSLLSYKNNTREDLSKMLSTLVGATKKKHCPFIILKDKYIFWADYEVFCKDSRGAFKISERPINKTVEEVYDYYIKILDKDIGDITVSELLQSTKDIFYKLDNRYFKNECNIKPYAYDKTIDKATMLSLIKDPNYILLCKKSYGDLTKSTKNKFYIKNIYIFLNKNDYIDKFVFALPKEDVLKELNLIV